MESIMNSREIAEQASDVFVMSDSFIRIKELIDDETATIDDIADVIMLDPALVATTLKLANSSFFNYPGKIDSISKALLVLGITEVYNLVIAYFTRSAFKRINADQAFLDEFWEQSVNCALMVKYIGSYLEIPHAERLFILGLLHNIGELIVEQFEKEKFDHYQKVCKKNNHIFASWKIQKKLFNFTFAECSADLLKFWGLPYGLIEPILQQNEENFQFISNESKVLYVAKRLNIYQQYKDKIALTDIISADKLEALALNEEVLSAASDYCDLERLSILALLNPGAAMIY
jgi:HD-like signal output (HDOD) protein